MSFNDLFAKEAEIKKTAKEDTAGDVRVAQPAKDAIAKTEPGRSAD